MTPQLNFHIRKLFALWIRQTMQQEEDRTVSCSWAHERAYLIRDAITVQGLRHRQHQHHGSLYHTLGHRGKRCW